ncbi:MAG TPA: response regulator transcription factor [Euzebyales bacterium]|nr:response regulator transcription factor [Euzebyales bacterium]
MITVVLVEDHTSYAQALAAVIELTDDIEVVGRAQSADEAAQVLGRQAADVVVVDLDLPGASGIDVLDDLRDRQAAAAAVVLTALTDEAELGRAVEAGAAAVLHKSVDVTELLEVIRRVAHGATVLAAGPTSSWLRALAAERERTWMARTIRDTLTPRETEILQLLAAGHGSDAIAARLVISADTVQTHVRNLLGKLGVGSRLEAVTLALRMGIVTPDNEDPGP